MGSSDYYPIIFKRKSIRNYELTPLDEGTLKNIKKEINSLKSLFKDVKTDFKIISHEDVNQRMMKKAPHYIAAFSESSEGYKTNIGFMLQQMDLYFSAHDLGSCWQGIPKPTKDVFKSSKLEFVILMAFGQAKVPLHRRSILEFKRKPLQKICNVSGNEIDELLEAARLAPSATNSQPWYFTGDKNIIHAYSLKPNIIRAIMLKKYIPIDMGIALYHLKVAAEHFSKSVEFIFDEHAQQNSPQGYEYVISIRLS
ncbi:MAG: nitroreductase family protein [Methanobacteriaceae archaeon]|nr:nitroreductase family protein [Methanobacteriaceae archaeon]